VVSHHVIIFEAGATIVPLKVWRSVLASMLRIWQSFHTRTPYRQRWTNQNERAQYGLDLDGQSERKGSVWPLKTNYFGSANFKL